MKHFKKAVFKILYVTILWGQTFAATPFDDEQVGDFRTAIAPRIEEWKTKYNTGCHAIAILAEANAWLQPDAEVPDAVTALFGSTNCENLQQLVTRLTAGMMLGHGFRNGVVAVTLGACEHETYYNAVRGISHYICAENEIDLKHLHTIEADPRKLNGHVATINELFAYTRGIIRVTAIGFMPGWRHLLDQIPDETIRRQAADDVAKFTTADTKLAVATAYMNAQHIPEDEDSRAKVIAEVKAAPLAYDKLDAFLRSLFSNYITNARMRYKAILELKVATTVRKKWQVNDTWVKIDSLLSKIDTKVPDEVIEAIIAAPAEEKIEVIQAWDAAGDPFAFADPADDDLVGGLAAAAPA